MEEYAQPVAQSTEAFNRYEEEVYGDKNIKEPEYNIHN